MTMTATAPILQIPEIFIGSGASKWNSTKPYQIWYGGRGSSKSWSKAIQWMIKAQSQPYFRGVFARDTQKNVRNAQYQLFKDLERRFDCFKGQFRFLDSTMKIECKQNGNMMMGGSFEQPDSLRSVADPTDFWAEEPITRSSQISRQDFFDIVGSLRNSEGIQTQFHFTFNPISKDTWIYKDFFEDALFDVEVVFANYWDNPFCPQSIIDFLESLRRLDPKRYLVDGLGNWGTAYEGLIYTDYETVDEMPEVQFYGLDFGHNDPCALVAGAVVDNFGSDLKDYYVKELLYKTKLRASSLIKELDSLGIKKNLPIICDNSRPEMIADLIDADYNAKPCFKYSGSVVDGINRVKNFNLKIVRPSKNLLDEIATYCYGEKNDQLLEEPDDGMDHALDAMRYASETQRITTVDVSDAERQAFGRL